MAPCCTSMVSQQGTCCTLSVCCRHCSQDADGYNSSSSNPDATQTFVFPPCCQQPGNGKLL